MINIDPLRPYFLLIKAGLALVLSAALFIGGCSHGQDEYKAKYEKERATHMAEVATARQAAVLQENQWKNDFAEISKQHKEDLKHAEIEGKRVTAGIIAGNLRLRSQWKCPAPIAGSGQGADEGALLRARDIGHLREIGERADAQIRGLQNTLKAERND